MIKQTILSILLVCRAISGQDVAPPIGSYHQYDPVTGLSKDDLVVTVDRDEKGDMIISLYITNDQDSESPKVDQYINYQINEVPLKWRKSSGDLYSVDYSSPFSKSTVFPYSAIDFKLDFYSSWWGFILTHRPTGTEYKLVIPGLPLSGQDHSKNLRGLAEPSSGGIETKKYCSVGDDNKEGWIQMDSEKGRLDLLFHNALDAQVCWLSVRTTYDMSGRYLTFNKAVNGTSDSARIKVDFSIIKDETADSYAVTYNGDNENHVVFKRC